MARDPVGETEHLLRRAGFSASAQELEQYAKLSVPQAVNALVEYDSVPDEVDEKIGSPGYVAITARAGFAPSTTIADARQRWLFRMVHSPRPLQEKMTVFWHNHFATAFGKISAAFGAAEATRYMAAKPSEDAAHVQGQVEMLRDNALGNFRDLLLNIAKNTAMLVWLDGRTNVKAKPQENFAREILDRFTMGVGNFTEADVYAGARVFTGWNLTRPGAGGDPAQHYEFLFNANQHDTAAKTFSFPIYPDGGRTIAARTAADGMQDGVDFINALAANENTARYLVAKLYRFFVSEFRNPEPAFVDRIAASYRRSGYDMKTVVREVLLSPQFWDTQSYFARYAWPVEFVVRAIKEVGWTGFSVNEAQTPLANMGQVLYEPPTVKGWDAGRTWFSTGAVLARMNFGAALASNQRLNLARSARSVAGTPESLLSYVLDMLPTSRLDTTTILELANYLRATTPWAGSDAQLQVKTPGLVHLVLGLPESQLM
jgi:uncharacterized protein (DUF1800 family)